MDSCLLLKIWEEILSKIEVKSWTGDIVKNFWIMLNNLQQMHLKLFSKRVSHSKNSNLIGKKIADKITSSSKTSPQNNSETSGETPLGKSTYLQNRIKTKNYWWFNINGRLIMKIYKNGISKNNKPIRWYNKSTI